jgi:hypothetical protein
MSSTITLSRRRFLSLSALAAAVPASMLLGTVRAADAALPHLSPDDATAKSLGYVENSSKLDAKTEPTFKAGSACASCALFQGKPGDAYGPCAVFAGKAVSSKGWCKSYAKKSG